MNTQDVVDEISAQTMLPTNQVRRVMSMFTTLTTEAVARGETVILTGFAKFEPVDRAARVARNPHTGERIDVPAKRTVRIKAMARLKEAVEQ